MAPPANAERVGRMGLDGVVVKLFGATAAAHDAHTRARGSFDQAVAGVRNLRAEGVPVELTFPGHPTAVTGGAFLPDWVRLARDLTGRDPVCPGNAPWQQFRPVDVRSPVLDERDIEHFLVRGWVRIDNGVDMAYLEERMAATERAIRERPDQVVFSVAPYYDEGEEETAWDFASYAFDDAATWACSRFRFCSDQSVSIPDVAPRAWTGLGQLIGSYDRICTDEMSDYLIVANGGSRREARLGRFHVDDPRSIGDLQSCRLGVLSGVLLSDVGTDGGGTALLSGSPGRIARWMRDDPDGADITDNEVVDAFVKAHCHDVDYMTGAAGDVYLCHPLLAHATSENYTDRVRAMSNPIIYVHEPLRFDADPATRGPVEDLVADALAAAD